MMELRIGDVAKLVGRHPETLRDYERKNVIPQARRDALTGWRVYSPEDVATIQRIIAGQRVSAEKEPVLA